MLYFKILQSILANKTLNSRFFCFSYFSSNSNNIDSVYKLYAFLNELEANPSIIYK